MDGSYCVKPLKQKQVVNAPFFPCFLPSSFCATFLCLSKATIHQSFISDPWPMGPAAFLPHCVPFLQVDGVSYLLQEIYGIENKYNSQESKVNIRCLHERSVSVCHLEILFLLNIWVLLFIYVFFNPQVADDEISDNSAECVVCLSDVRDTLILPCRHLCLCNACADTLRYQANCCPICRLREFPSAMKNCLPNGPHLPLRICCWNRFAFQILLNTSALLQ